jgi:hypothetical protein
VSRTGNDRPAILHCGWPQQNPEWALAEENGVHAADVAALEQIRIDVRVRRWRMKQPDGSSVSESFCHYQSDIPQTLFL